MLGMVCHRCLCLHALNLLLMLPTSFWLLLMHVLTKPGKFQCQCFLTTTFNFSILPCGLWSLVHLVSKSSEHSQSLNSSKSALFFATVALRLSSFLLALGGPPAILFTCRDTYSDSIATIQGVTLKLKAFRVSINFSYFHSFRRIYVSYY